MTGLIAKDMLVSKRSLKSYLGIMIFYAVLTFIGIFNVAFVTAFVSVMLIMLPIGAFSYDETAKWDRYAMALPLGRSAVVGARYLFALLVALLSLAFALVAGAAVEIAGKGDWIEVIIPAMATLAMGLFATDVLLPLCYKLGPERARPYLYAIVFVPAIGMFVAFRMGVHIDTSWLDRIAESAPLVLLLVFCLPLLAALALMAVSYLISCRVVSGRSIDMTAAVVLLWTGCLWSITRSVLWLVWLASPWRRLLVLAALALSLTHLRSPEEMRKKYQTRS